MRKGWLYTREEILWYVKDNREFTWNKEEQYNPNEVNVFTEGMSGTKVHPNKRYTNVWTDIPEQLVKKDRLHPASKPLEASRRIIKVSTKEGDLVFDPFCGTGSALLAAQSLGRSYLGVEKDKAYFERAQELLADN